MAEKIPMGIGHLGFSNMTFKRKFRYTLQLTNICGVSNNNVPEHYVKTAGRPSLSIEETEFNYLNAKAWIPGKASWETLTVTYIDVATQDIIPLYQWLTSVYNFTGSFTGSAPKVDLTMGANRNDYSCQAILKLWDGCGNIMEMWEMSDVWPTSINFGDLDYSSSDETTVELTLRYNHVVYTNKCPGFNVQPCCTGCDNSSNYVGDVNIPTNPGTAIA